MTKMIIIYILLAIASVKMLSLYQMDVKNIFLHGRLKEIVYMEPPLGYPLSITNIVCKVNKSLYGLRQAPWVWFGKLCSAICYVGFQ